MPSAFPAVKMFHRTEMENYKLQVEMLQEKLQRSEEKRKQIEDQYYKIQKKRIDHEKCLKSKTRAKFEQFLDEQQTRNERNKGIIKMLDKIDEQTAVLQSRSERLKTMKQQYELYFGKLLQHQAIAHSPRYTILPLTQQPSPSPQFLTTPNALNYYPNNLQNTNSYQIGVQPQPAMANNIPTLSTNQIIATSTIPAASATSSTYPLPQHPMIITNPNDFAYRYPMNPYDYYNNQILLNQPQLFQQQIQTLQQPTMLQIPIQQHQIPPLPLGIPLRTGGVIPIASPSSNSLIKPNFDKESMYPQANYTKQEEKNENEFEKSNKKISSDFKYNTNNDNNDNKNVYNNKNSTKSYLDNYDIRQHKFHSLDDFQDSKEKQRRTDIYDDYKSRQQYQGNKSNDDEDDDDDEMDEKDSLQQSPKSKSIKKSTEKNIDNDNDYLLKKDWNKNKIPDKDDMKMDSLSSNNDKTTPKSLSVHPTDELTFSVKPNSPKERTQKNNFEEKFAEISLKERQPIDITKYPDGYYLHQDDKSPNQLPSHMWNFSGRLPNEKAPSPLADPSKFEKKEKLSIENIENAIYGELIDPALSDLNDITQLELKTPNPMRPELLRAKLTDFKEVIEPAPYMGKPGDVEKVPSPMHALNMKSPQQPLIKEKPGEYTNPEIVKYNVPKPELLQRQPIEKIPVPQTKPEEYDAYQPGLNQALLKDPNITEDKINDQIPQYEQYDQTQYDQAQYDQTQYEQNQYEQPAQFETEVPQQQYSETYNDQSQIQYDAQQQDYQYPAEQAQEYTEPDYQNYDAQQYPEGYDPNQYPQYNYDQSDPNYQQDPNQQYTENYDQQGYKTEEYQQDVDYQNYDQTGATEQLIASDPVQVHEQDPATQNIHTADIPVAPQDTVQETVIAPVSPKQSVKGAAVKPILSKEKSVDSENKKKKRVNFIDSSDESSAAPKPEVAANESDFDFSSSN